MRTSVLQETVDFLRRAESWTQFIREAEGDEEEGGGEDAPEEPAPEAPKTEPKDAVAEAKASIDDQVNKVLAAAVKEAALAKSEGFDHRSMARRLLEADEDSALEGPKKTLEDIDIGSMAASIVRLRDNFDSLIEVQNTVVEMAKVQLKKAFDDTVIKALVQLLEEEYDISSGESQWDKDLENQPPPARGAGPTGG